MSFYLGRYAELYDLFYRDKPYAAEARFVYGRLRFHGKTAPQRILELACGTGTHAIELAKLGCKVTATDVSSGMLEVAKSKSEAANIDVKFTLSDMRALTLPQEAFDAAICLFDSIGYVQTDGNISEVLVGTRKNLKPGGLFLFEFWHAPAMLKKFDPMRVKRIETANGTIIRISETSLAKDRSVAHVKYDLYELKADSTYEHFSETQTNRFFTLDEMKSKAKAHGFEPLAAYSGFSNSAAVTDETWHVVAVWKAI